MAESRIRVVQQGLGPIGRQVARLVASRPSMVLVGGVDVDPDAVGRNLEEVIGVDRPLGVRVTDSLAALLAETDVDVVLNCTGSALQSVARQLEPIIVSGIDVISTCEELSHPVDDGLATELDALARKHGATVVGTGINPGFAMDTLPALLTTVCQEVHRVSVLRVVDASERREPLQRKIGAGMTLKSFDRLVTDNKVRHVGMLQSVAAVACMLGWVLDDMVETIEPVIAEEAVETPCLRVEPGEVAGVRQVGTGFRNGHEVIRLELRMYVGADEPIDRVEIGGTPSVVNELRGIHGDLSTAAVVVNCIPQVLAASPGLLTMADLALPHYHDS